MAAFHLIIYGRFWVITEVILLGAEGREAGVEHGAAWNAYRPRPGTPMKIVRTDPEATKRSRLGVCTSRLLSE